MEADPCKPLKERIAQLEDENDLLATANVDLRRELTKVKKKLEIFTALSDRGADGETPSREALPPAPANKKGPERKDLLPLPKLIVDDAASNSTYAKTEVARITDVCGNMNPICVVFSTGETHTRLDEHFKEKVEGASTLVLVGGVDKIVRVYAYSHKRNQHSELFRVEVSAPVLGIECCGDQAACALMDGTMAVMHLPTASTRALDNKESTPTMSFSSWGQPGLTSLKHHSKYLACVAFNAEATVLCAVCPGERAISLYRESDGAWAFLASLTLDASPESAVYMPVQGEGVELKGEVLVIALRDSANLVALRGTTTSPVMKEGSAPLQFTEYRVPLNEQEWDTHASFSALSLAVSTDSVALETANAKKGVCGPLAVSTDKGAHLLVAWEGSSQGKFHSSDASLEAAVAAGVGGVEGKLQVAPAERVAMLHDHNCSEYGKPSVAWGSDKGGKARFLYSNSEEESFIYVYDTLQARTRALAGAQTNTSGSIGASGSVAKLQGHKGIVRGLATHPALGLLASVSYDHSLVMWR